MFCMEASSAARASAICRMASGEWGEGREGEREPPPVPVLVEVEALAEAELDMIAMLVRRKDKGSLRSFELQVQKNQ